MYMLSMDQGALLLMTMSKVMNISKELVEHVQIFSLENVWKLTITNKFLQSQFILLLSQEDMEIT